MAKPKAEGAWFKGAVDMSLLNDMETLHSKTLRVTVQIAPVDLPRLGGLDVVAVEEQTPTGWTRRLPERAKGKH